MIKYDNSFASTGFQPAVTACSSYFPGYSQIAYLADPVNLQAASKVLPANTCAYVGLYQTANPFEPDFNWTWTYDNSSLQSKTPFGISDIWRSNQPGDRYTTYVENCAAMDNGGPLLGDYACDSSSCLRICSIAGRNIYIWIVFLKSFISIYV
jgi:hypothetical protein